MDLTPLVQYLLDKKLASDETYAEDRAEAIAQSLEGLESFSTSFQITTVKEILACNHDTAVSIVEIWRDSLDNKCSTCGRRGCGAHGNESDNIYMGSCPR